MRLKDLKPVSGETLGAVLGMLLSLLLHLVAFVAIIAVGTAIDSQERGKPPDSASIVRVYEEGAP